jgi:hypothetical protein
MSRPEHMAFAQNPYVMDVFRNFIERSFACAERIIDAALSIARCLDKVFGGSPACSLVPAVGLKAKQVVLNLA